jgi:hypothetical protein
MISFILLEDQPEQVWSISRASVMPKHVAELPAHGLFT